MTDTKTDWSEMRKQVNKAAGTFFITAFLIGLGFLLGNYYRADKDHGLTDRLQDQRMEAIRAELADEIAENRKNDAWLLRESMERLDRQGALIRDMELER